MITSGEFKKLCSFAQLTAVKAGELLIKMSKNRHKISYKGRVNLVTEADLASEEFITETIKKKYPLHSILAEEEAAIENESEFRWIIDPLDGTTNYAHDFPFWCVSIALEFNGQIVVGAIHDPLRKEMFSAVKGGGAYLNKKKISVSTQQSLEKALLATGFPYDIGTSRENNLKYFDRFARKARGVRRAGSAALDLCYLACGRFDGFWELKLSPWDTAAGTLIVKEAGGKVTDFRGSRYSIYDKYILASNRKIHAQMMRVLAE